MNIDDYIELVQESKKDVQLKLDNFVDLLNKIKNKPELILTEFFCGLDNPLFMIAHYNSLVNSEAMLPLVKTIKAFEPFDLKANSSDSISVHFKNQSGSVMRIEMRSKAFYGSWKEPKKASDIKESRFEKMGVLLNNFIDNKNLKTAYALIHNPYKYKVHVIDLFKSKLLNEVSEKVNYEKQHRIKSNLAEEERYKERLVDYYKYNDIVVELINYLESIGYTYKQY